MSNTPIIYMSPWEAWAQGPSHPVFNIFRQQLGFRVRL